eukprot:COSAG01_NODE_1131_length_11572_cov_84.273337_11_plen_78_part_00
MSSALQQSLSSSTASPVPADPLDLELEERSMDEEHGAASVRTGWVACDDCARAAACCVSAIPGRRGLRCLLLYYPQL